MEKKLKKSPRKRTSIAKKVASLLIAASVASPLVVEAKAKKQADNELFKILKKEKRFKQGLFDHGVVCN